MKNAIAVTLAGALFASASAKAETLEEKFAGQVFRSHGQCLSAMTRERNKVRREGDDTGREDASYSWYSNQWYQCIEIERNAWIVVREWSKHFAP